MLSSTAIGEVRGLPAHVLLVHGVVVLVPLAAGLLVLAAWWPAARVRLGPLLPMLAAGCLVLVPITMSAGRWLKSRVGNTALIRQHTQLGVTLLPWTVGLFVLALAVWLLGRQHDNKATEPAARRPPLVTIGVAVLATLVAAGAIVQTVRIGESGSKAVWSSVVSSN